MRANSPSCSRTRHSRRPRPCRYSSAASTRAVRSGVTCTPGASRLDRHGDAGLSQVGRPQARARARHVGLGEAGLLQRVADAVFRGRLQARPIVALVVEVGAAANHVHAQTRQQRLDATIQLALAVIAAGTVVADVIRVGELGGGDDEMTDADLLCQPPGVLDFGARHAGAVGGDGDGVVAERRKAAWATTVLSMPPLKATAVLPRPRSTSRSRSRFALRIGAAEGSILMMISLSPTHLKRRQQKEGERPA